MSRAISVFSVVSIFFSSILSTYSQSTDVNKILAILDRQTAAWNKGDIENFMVGYWENDSLMYIGKGGVTYGYGNTIKRYKENYSDTARMGKLKFTILHVNKISRKAYFVVGKWHLTRSIGDVGGHYTLLFRKIKGEWVVVADHSS
jgi:hypothetical protein